MTYPAHVRCLLPLLFGALFVGAGCGEPPAPAQHGGTALGAANAALPDTVETLDYKLQPEVVTSAVEEPWAIAFLSADSALVTEQPGRLRLLVDGTMLPDSIHGTPEVSYLGVQGGLLDVAVDPNYDRNGWIYLTYAHGLSAAEDAQPPTMIRVVRGRIRNGAWQDQQVLFEAPHDTYRTTRFQFGSRITFDSQGHLYFSIGDRGAWPVDTTTIYAQDLSRPGGKIYRTHRDGSLPQDNPFLDHEDALPSIYTYGHRNPQGLATHPETGTVWALEHGPRGGDELNRLIAGQNYGWPEVAYGINYDGTIITPDRERENMRQPVFFWRPSIATSGLAFYRGAAFPYWSNQALISSLKAQEVRLLTIENRRVLHQEVILEGAGRVREAVPSPDGAIYLVMNGPDRIVRLRHLADFTTRSSNG